MLYATHIGDNFLQQVLSLVYTEGYSTTDMPDTKIFVPTNRLAKALQTEILRKFDGKPTLMPQITSISSDDSIAETAEFYGGAYITPPVDSTERQLWLADTVWAYYHKSTHLQNISFAMAMAYANQLAKLFDNLHLYEVDFDDLLNCIDNMRPNVSEHWAVTTTFLQHFYPLWQQHLQQQGICDIGAYRMQCFQQIIHQIQTHTNHIFCVGFTATYPIIGRLLDAVQNLQHGTVILPAYAHTAYTDAIRNDPSHPQYLMASYMGDTRPHMLPAQKLQRHTLCTQVFLPAVCTQDWNTIPQQNSHMDTDTLFSGIRFMQCTTPTHEAMSIALALRHVLETKGKTGALITADKNLSRMVISILKRWHIAIDDSSGMPLHLTPEAVFMRLVIDTQAENFTPTALVKLLKHPLCHMGYNRGYFLQKVRTLETYALRGYIIGTGIQGIIDTLYHRLDNDRFFLRHIKAQTEKTAKIDNMVQFLQKINQAFAPLSGADTDIKSLLMAHIQVAESLSKIKTDAHILWHKQEGHVLSKTCAHILDKADVITFKQGFSIPDYKQVFESLLQGQTVRKTYGMHPRLYIWGTLEGRLQTVDTVIFGGCNEGTLPPPPNTNIWVSNTMAKDLKLPTIDRSVGVSAHDVLSACNGDTVLFSRSEKHSGSPTIASRWWQRFEAVGKAYGMSSLPKPDTDYAKLAHHMDMVTESIKESVKISEPKPTPPIASRPTQLSMTNIQTWYEDPYQIYAQHILKLYKFDDLATDSNPAFKGSLIHAILEDFAKKYSHIYYTAPHNTDQQHALQNLCDIADAHFALYQNVPAVQLQIKPEFNDFAPQFIEQFWQRLIQTTHMYFEKNIQYTLQTQNNNPFTIRGIADRIDITQDKITKDNKAIIVDYKTGTEIPKKLVNAGKVPQLILQSYMVTQGACEDIPNCTSDMAEYWMTKRKFSIVPYEQSDTLDTTLNALYTQIDTYADDKTPYYKQYRTGKAVLYNNYAHLFREDEWNTTEGDT